MTETPSPHGQAPCSSFESQYRRVFEAAGCKTPAELAVILEISQSAIHGARRRGKIPAEWLIVLLEKKRINPEWILYDGCVKYLIPSDTCPGMPHVVRITEVRPPEECSAQDLFNELTRRALETPDFGKVQK